MTIAELGIKMNDPLRVVTADDALKMKRDFRQLIVNPTLQHLWVDRTGHLHQKVEIINFKTLLLALLDSIYKAIYGLSFSESDKPDFLILKSKEILDKFIPYFLTQVSEKPEEEAGKLFQLAPLYDQLIALESKVDDKKIFESRKSELTQILNELKTGSHFSSLLKTALAGQAHFSAKPAYQKFLEIPPSTLADRLKSPQMAINHARMVQLVLLVTPESAKAEVKQHAARHLCALEKMDKGDQEIELKAALHCAEEALDLSDLLEAAAEFKIIPSRLDQNLIALTDLLQKLVIAEEIVFAGEVVTRLEASLSGKMLLDELVKKEAEHLNDPQFQERCTKRILFLTTLCPSSEQIQAALADLEQLAIYGDLPATAIQQLMPRGQIIRQLYTSFHQAQQLPANELLKVLQELMTVSLTLFVKTNEVEIAEFIDEVCLQLVEGADAETLQATLSASLASGMINGNQVKLEKVVSALLIAYAVTQSESTAVLFRNVCKTLFASNEGLLAIQTILKQQIATLARDDLAFTALNLLRIELGEQLELATDSSEQEVLKGMRSQISVALQEFAKFLNDPRGLDKKFDSNFANLLAEEQGFADLEGLIKEKSKVLSKSFTPTQQKIEAKNYLRALQTKIVEKNRRSESIRLQELSDIITQTLEAAHFGQLLRSRTPRATMLLAHDLEVKVLNRDLARYLYNSDGSLAQTPFVRPI